MTTNTLPKLPAKSLDFFLSLARDACNWSGQPWLNGNVAAGHGASAMSQTLVRKGVIVVEQGEQPDGPAAYAVFTQTGARLAAEHGIDLSIYDPIPDAEAKADRHLAVVTERLEAAEVAPATEYNAEPAGKSFAEADAPTHTCTQCAQELPVNKFPTITGTGRRSSRCRKCRDAK